MKLIKKIRARKVSCFISIILMVSLAFGITTKASFLELSGDVLAHDPTLICEDGLWWAPATGTGLAMKYSPDGYNWTYGTQIFASEPSWWRTYAPNMGSNDVWAPDIEYYRGRYYMFYSVSEFGKNNSAIGLTSCSSILAGDWQDDGMILSSSTSDSYNAIDPNLVVDANGKPWLVFGSWFDGIHIVRLNSSTMKPSGEVYDIAYRSGGIEGACMMYVNGYYYLFASVGVCCQGVNSTYKIIYGRSTSVTGPFYDKNGVDLSDGGGTVLDSGNNRWIGPGGQDIYKYGSTYYLTRHAYDAENNGAPTMLISTLDFSSGWPSY